MPAPIEPPGEARPQVEAPSGTGLFAWFKPAPPRPRLPADQVAQAYPRLRWQVFEAAFIAYATFYLVRNNFAPVSKEVGAALHYDKVMIGQILAGTAFAYGVGKLVMGYLADRSDARKYLALGMLLTACVNLLFGATANYKAHFCLWTLNGFVQGMGYGPCVRGLAHWYSLRERGKVFGVWLSSHCVGGGLAGYFAAFCTQHWGWPSAFYVPGALAAICAVYLFWRMRDTPQSQGLPPIEEYNQDWPPGAKSTHDQELTFREIFLHQVLTNKRLWVLAVANIFVYIARYAMVDWGPTYLKEAKGASLVGGGLSTVVIELSGAVGMFTMGWLSDKTQGRRARLSALAMLPLVPAFLGLVASHSLALNYVLFGIIGFFVYTPVSFSGVVAVDLTSKKAAATATGFVGMFGYVGGRMLQGIGLGWLAEHYGWNAGIYAVSACILIGTALLALLWKVEPKG